MSNIIKHDWNGAQIGQVVSEFELSGKTIPVGYVDLAAIAKAGSKQLRNFWANETTKELLNKLSGIPDSFPDKLSEIPDSFPPVITIEGRNGGTYGCLEIALELCGWVSVDFKVWGLRTLTKVVTGQAITNDDRAEGWAKMTEAGIEVPLAEPKSPDPLVDWDFVRFCKTTENATGKQLSHQDIFPMYLQWQKRLTSAKSTQSDKPRKPYNWQARSQSFAVISAHSHLWQWMEETGFSFVTGQIIKVDTIWAALQEWYKSKGVLADTDNGRVWKNDLFLDPPVKGPNMIAVRL